MSTHDIANSDAIRFNIFGQQLNYDIPVSQYTLRYGTLCRLLNYHNVTHMMFSPFARSVYKTLRIFSKLISPPLGGVTRSNMS